MGQSPTLLRVIPHIRYHIAAILAIHWIEFLKQYKEWVRPVVFENVRKILSCRTPVLGCHIYQCNCCGHIKLISHSCKSRFCPTCGKHATDVWSNRVLNNLLDVPYHHLIMTIPWQLRIVILMNREIGLNLLARSASKVGNCYFNRHRLLPFSPPHLTDGTHAVSGAAHL